MSSKHSDCFLSSEAKNSQAAEAANLKASRAERVKPSGISEKCIPTYSLKFHFMKSSERSCQSPVMSHNTMRLQLRFNILELDTCKSCIQATGEHLLWPGYFLYTSNSWLKVLNSCFLVVSKQLRVVTPAYNHRVLLLCCLMFFLFVSFDENLFDLKKTNWDDF